MKEENLDKRVKQVGGIIITVQVAVGVLISVEDPPPLLFTALLIVGISSGVYTALSVMSGLVSSGQ